MNELQCLGAGRRSNGNCATSARMDWTATVSCCNTDSLINALGKLRQQVEQPPAVLGVEVDTVTVLVLGKGGVGKSSTVNSLIGERVAVISAFQSETTRPIQCARSRAGFTLNIIDTPGLVEGGCVNDQALDIIRRFLLNKTIDVMLYVDRLDGYRVDNLDKQVIRAITQSFGSQIWRIGVVVLTHAQFLPADGVEYLDFVSKRSAALQAVIQEAAGRKRSEKSYTGSWGYQLLRLLKPSGLSGLFAVEILKPDLGTSSVVENSGRCNVNSGGEKILPNDTVWLLNLVERIVEVATGESKSILVDSKLINGPNANQTGKLWIPLALLAQFFLIVWPIHKSIKRDLEEEKQQRPALGGEG
ncbi:unnamed protein product [Sphagnum balticum]